MADDPRDILFSYALRIIAVVLERLGKANVESIFVSGGLARNEIAAFRFGDAVEIYSDVDLFVIVRQTLVLDTARRIVKDAVSTLEREGDGYRIFAPPDVGVFSEDDFLAQPARPGMVEIAESHIVLHGNDEIPLKAAKFSAKAIHPAEALYLLENRLDEIAALDDGSTSANSGGNRRYAEYVLLKSCLDAAAAVLIVLGRFHPARGEREKRLREARSDGELGDLVEDNTLAKIEKSFRLRSGLQETLEANDLAGAQSRTDTARLLLDVWRGIAGRLCPSSTSDWGELFDWRCKEGRRFSNARELSAIARKMSRPRVRLFISGDLVNFSPVDILRLWGAASFLYSIGGSGPGMVSRIGDEAGGGYVSALDRLTRAFGYASGGLFERGRRMFEEAR